MTTLLATTGPLQERDPNTTAAPPASSGQKDPATKKLPSKKKSSPSKESAKPLSVADLSHIHINGEEEEAVPIFDTCDDVRKKINEHLKAPGVTQASFCRDLSELLPYGDVKPRQMAKFLAFKGPRGGGHSAAFYPAYVYFEKLRLDQGKKKSAKREKLEAAWENEGGFPREGDHNLRFTCIAGEKPRMDYLGCVQITGAPSMRSGAITRKKLRR